MDGTPLLGREHLVEQAGRALANGRSVILRGEPGVGTTAVATRVVARLPTANHHVVALRATPGTKAIPLAPLLVSVGMGGLRSADTEARSSQFAQIRSTIVQHAGERTVVYLVDDIDLLDDASLVFVHQSVLADGARLVATLHQDHVIPPLLADLSRFGRLDRIDVAPFTREASGRVAEYLAGATLDDSTKKRLWRWCRGNALFIGEVIAAARDRGLLDGPEPIVIDPLPVRAPSLMAVVEERLSHLSDDDRQALTHLAFAEPCGPAELASVADVARLGELERRRLVQADHDGARLRLRLAHPLYGEVIRAQTGPIQGRAILATLARDLLATGARRRADVIPLARFAIDGGVEVETDVLVQATSYAYHAGELALSERIGRRAYERTGDFTTGWDLLNCLLLLGDRDGARRLLEEWGARPERPAARLAVAAVTAQVEFWLGGDDEAALATIDAALEAVQVDVHDGIAPTMTRGELLAMRGVIEAAAGRHREALGTVMPLLELDEDPTRIRAAYAAAHALRGLGRPASALEVLDDAMLCYERLGIHGVSLPPRLLQRERSLALAYLGRMDEAMVAANSIREDTTNDVYQSLSWWSTSIIDAMSGRTATGLDEIDRARRLSADLDRYGIVRRWGLALDALMRSATAATDEAAAVLAQFDDDHHPARTLDVMGEIARSRVLAARQYPEDARALMRAEMARHRERGAVNDEAFCGLELIRLGRPDEVADRLAELAAAAEGPLYRLIASQARGVSTQDHVALGEVSDELAALGCFGFATETAVWAMEAAEAQGDDRTATRWRRRANALRARCEALPEIVERPEPAVPITSREREIAMMAAAGLSSKQIAARLFISTRTVDNHLAKVYRKLGVRARTDLAAVLEGGARPR